MRLCQRGKSGTHVLLFFLTFAGTTGVQSGFCTSAAEYRRMADQAVSAGRYADAVEYYRKEAQVYRAHGDVNGAKIEETKADRWESTVEAYVESPADRRTVLGLYTGAKFEPVYGCYVGGYVEADDRLRDATDSSGRAMLPEEAMGAAAHKRMGTFFQYCHYGEKFPTRWAKALCDKGIAPHISLEPNAGLEYVQDDRYLQEFALAAKACRGPIFLRFAAEMNGDWTTYHRDPSLYRIKFRLVHDVMARLAPNVAMIWCVNSTPEYNIDDYYPGDQYVDWVGVNMYSVLHHDNSADRPAWFENPADMIKYVYHEYGARKPIAICEWGASHREALNPSIDHSDIAYDKIAELFAALPRQYPRVKLIDYFDCDNLTHARPGRQLNDYCLTNSETALSEFQKAIAPDYFLTDVVSKPQTNLPLYIHNLCSGATLSGKTRLSAWVKTYEDRPTVVYSLDGRAFAHLNNPGEYPVDLDTARYTPGRHVLTVQVLDSHGRRACQTQIPVVFSRLTASRPDSTGHLK